MSLPTVRLVGQGSRGLSRKSAVKLALLLSLLACTSKTDEELWLERINTSKVHSYTALKILIAEPERDADVRAARTLFDELSHSTMPGAATDPVEAARQAFTLGRALWTLRGLGEAEVAKGRQSTLLVFREPRPAAGAAVVPGEPLFNKELEHGLLLFLLLMSKLDTRAPTPVPPEVLLYEAYMAGTAPLPDALLAGIVLSAQTTVTADAELCDVAGRFSDELVKLSLAVDAGAARSLLLGALAASGAKEAKAEDIWLKTLVDTLPWGLRLLAHGKAAICFDGRKQTDKARVEWERAVALAGQAGIPPADLALVQAYAAYRAKDWPQTRAHLQRASSSTLLTPDEREQLLQMAERFDEKDPGPFESMFDRAFVARTILGMVDQRMRTAGVYDQLLTLPEVLAARRALQSLGEPVLNVENEGWWQKLRGMWSSEETK